jgi:hypothetical protein
MLLCSSSNPSIWGVALSWKKRPHGSGVSNSIMVVLFIIFVSVQSLYILYIYIGFFEEKILINLKI